MELKELNDLNLINEIILNPFVQDDIADDSSLGVSLAEIPSHMRFIGVYDNDILCGLYMLIPQNCVTVEVHTCLLPLLRGKKAIQAGRLIIQYMFDRYRKIISWIPVDNKKAELYSKLLGFKVEGISRESYLKNGKLQDMKLVGITIGEYKCQ